YSLKLAYTHPDPPSFPTRRSSDLVDTRYKLTVYRHQPYGELFDLETDPQEVHNLWDVPEAAALKALLLHRAVQHELQREPTRMRSEEHTSELQSHLNLVCRLLLEK